MDERLRFVARLLEGETTAVLCLEFEISRKLCVGLGSLGFAHIYSKAPSRART